MNSPQRAFVLVCRSLSVFVLCVCVCLFLCVCLTPLIAHSVFSSALLLPPFLFYLLSGANVSVFVCLSGVVGEIPLVSIHIMGK